ncbi:MAG: hypothetical protein U0527_13775 [Candidatus Eisenbacteria bacterium]
MRARFALVLLVLLLAAACGKDSTAPRVTPTPAAFGVAVNRRGAEPLLAEAYAEIKQGGFRLAAAAAAWGDLESRAGQEHWEILDRHFREAREDSVALSITILLIDNQAVGAMPDDRGPVWIEDAFFRQRICRLAQRVATRFPDVVRYLWIGREVDAYFANNVGEIGDFITLVDACQDSVARVAPQVRVGTTVSYVEAEAQGRLAMVDQLAEAGSILGLSVYGRDLSNAQSLDPEGTVARTRAAVARFQTHRVMVTEVGFPYDQSAPAVQQRFVELLTSYLGDPPDNLVGAVWESLHDWSPAEADARALLLFAGEEERRSNYARQLRSAGLRSVDGVLRPAFISAADWNHAVR